MFIRLVFSLLTIGAETTEVPNDVLHDALVLATRHCWTEHQKYENGKHSFDLEPEERIMCDKVNDWIDSMAQKEKK